MENINDFRNVYLSEEHMTYISIDEISHVTCMRSVIIYSVHLRYIPILFNFDFRLHINIHELFMPVYSAKVNLSILFVVISFIL